MTTHHLETAAILLSATLLSSVMSGAPASPAGGVSTFRTFELRGVSSDPKADGETDFKGETAVYSTEERVSFLNAYADFAAPWFGDAGLEKPAVSETEIAAALAQLKPQPLPSVRRDIRIEHGWKQAAGAPASPVAPKERPWRTRPGVVVRDGELALPAGTTEILDLAACAGWRHDLMWSAKTAVGSSLDFDFGGVAPPESARPPADGRWHDYRLQSDLAEGRAFLSVDGKCVAGFQIQKNPSGRSPFVVRTAGEAALTRLTFVDYRPDKDIARPYVAVVLADDDFREKPAIGNWAAENHDDSRWLPAELPCVHGGFREAGEDLYLRRKVELPAFARIVLEVETLDPSGEIYLGGERVATIPSRTPVRLDVTRFAKPGANLLAFKVNHNEVANLSHHSNFDKAVGWFAGRATLHVTPAMTVIREFLPSTRSLDPASGAAVQTQRVTLDNAGDAPFEGRLTVDYRRWFPVESDAIAGTATLPVVVPAHGALEVVVPVEIDRAAPWSPERPALYSATATLRNASGEAADDLVVTTGVRTIAQRDGKLFLNGKEILLIGAQTMGFRPVPFMENAAKYNRCAPLRSRVAEMLAIKNFGGNLLRVHDHAAKTTPDGINDPRIPEMADQLGLALFWGTPAWLREGDERLVNTRDLGAYMRQVFAHPSIVDWELGNHPNEFKKSNDPQRTHDYVRRVVRAVLAEDDSRLISPTTFWGHTHYGNDLGTQDWKGRPLAPVPEYTHPLVTRGSQDAPTGYGAEWSALRDWPWKGSIGADCLKNKIRPWFNFEHEESAAQANPAFSEGWPWHKLRSYEQPYDGGSVGRTLGFGEWRASQAFQAFGAYESMKRQIHLGVVGFSWCTLEGGANSGTYEKPLLDNFGRAKLAWYIHKMLTQEVFAGSDDVDTVYGPHDTVRPVIFNRGPARRVDLVVTVRKPGGEVVDERTVRDIRLPAGRSLTRLPGFRPKLPTSGPCAVEYTVVAPRDDGGERRP